MDGVLTTVIIGRDGIGMAMVGVALDLGSMSMERQNTNVREQPDEGQREHDDSHVSSTQHHRIESIWQRRWLSNGVSSYVRVRHRTTQLPHRTS